MKILVAGTRTFNDYDLLKEKLSPILSDTTLLITGAGEVEDSEFTIHTLPDYIWKDIKGADYLALRWAKEYTINIRLFPADWLAYGRAAGPIRNEPMAQFCDFAIVFWDGKSRGSKNLIKHLNHYKKQYIIYKYNRDGKVEENESI